MGAAAMNGAQRFLVPRRQLAIAQQDLRIAEDAVQRGAQLVGKAGHIAALGGIRRLGRFLGLLQLFVGLAVGFDLLHQQVGLAVRLLLGDVAAFTGQHHPPGENPGEQREHQECLEKRLIEGFSRLLRAGRDTRRDLAVDQPERQRKQADDQAEHTEVVRQAGVQARDGHLREGPTEEVVPLRREPRVRLAQVATARIERAAQRADRRTVGGAEGSVRLLEGIAAQHAGDFAALGIGVEQLWLTFAGDIEAPAGNPGDQWCADQCGAQRDHR